MEKFKELYYPVQFSFLFANLLFTLSNIKIPGVFFSIYFMASTLMYLGFKDVLQQKIRAFTLYQITTVLFATGFMNNWMQLHTPMIAYGFYKAASCFMVASIVAVLGFVYKQKIYEAFDKIHLPKAKETETKSESKYDIVICKEKDTNKDVVLEEKSRYMHMLCIGPTGCGKTSQILLPMILQDIQKKNAVIVIEPKGDLAEKVYAMGKEYDTDVIYMDPTSPLCPSFNPLAGKEDEVIETFTTTMNMLTPDSKQYFQDMSNNLLRKSIMVLKRIEAAYMDEKTGISQKPATLLGLSDIIHNTENRGRRMITELLKLPVINASEEKQNKDTAEWFNDEYYAAKSKTYENTSGTRTQVANLIQNKHLRKVLNPQNGQSDIDFDEILAKGRSIAITTAQGELRELGSYLGYFLIFNLQASIFRRPGNEFTRTPCFLYIDEFQKYASPQFADVLTMARSYAVGAILATQSREQIAMGAGSAGRGFLEVISANARNVVLFPGISPTDADFYSKMFGEHVVRKERYTETKQKFHLAYGFQNMRYPSEGISYSDEKEAIFNNTQLTYKQFSEITYRIIKNNTVQYAKDGIAAWIPKPINDKINQIVEEYNAEKNALRQKEELEEQKQRAAKYANYNKVKPKKRESNDKYTTVA